MNKNEPAIVGAGENFVTKNAPPISQIIDDDLLNRCEKINSLNTCGPISIDEKRNLNQLAAHGKI